MISIEGLNLNIGSSISIYLDNIPCEVNQSQVKKILYILVYFNFFLLIDTIALNGLSAKFQMTQNPDEGLI